MGDSIPMKGVGWLYGWLVFGKSQQMDRPEGGMSSYSHAFEPTRVKATEVGPVDPAAGQN